MQVIDARGLSCPEPVLLAQKAMKTRPDEAFKIMVDVGAASQNITRLAKTSGWTVSCKKVRDHFELILRKE